MKIEKRVAAAIKKNPGKIKIIVSEAPKPIHKISKAEAIKLLRRFRDGWEMLTTRNEDLPDERLESEKVSALRSHLKWYYSDEAHAIAARYLVGLIRYF